MRRQRGITLIELLLALTVAVIVIMAAGNSYVLGLRYAQNMDQSRTLEDRRQAFETSLRDLFRHTFLDPDTGNQNCYFMSGDAVNSKVANSTSSSSSSGSTGNDESTLVFTVIGRRLPNPVLNSADDFETANQKRGPQGGATEIQLGLTPVGDGGAGKTGLFMREQTPPDGDPTQGGEESVLSPDIESIRFEFWDGTTWQTSWDTTTMGTRRLPASVRVTYKLTDEQDERTMIIPIPESDVTTDNPVEQGT